MNIESEERNAYEGTIRVTCEVIVDIDSDTGSNMMITRGIAQDVALEYVKDALHEMESDNVRGATAVSAKATAMSIRWAEDDA